jgi:hypothetical protein
VSVRASNSPAATPPMAGSIGFTRRVRRSTGHRVESSVYAVCALTIGVTVGSGDRHLSARAHDYTAEDRKKSRRRVTAAASSSLADDEDGDPFDPFTKVPPEDWEVDWEADGGDDGMEEVWLGSDDDDEQGNSRAASEQTRRPTRLMTQAVQTGRRVRQDTLCVGYVRRSVSLCGCACACGVRVVASSAASVCAGACSCGVLITADSSKLGAAGRGDSTKVLTSSTKDLKLNSFKMAKLEKSARRLNMLCRRCELLREDDVRGAWAAAADVPAEVFRNQLAKLKAQRVLVLLVVDATDFDGSFYGQLRNLIGGNPVVMAVTKSDLLPGYPEHTRRSHGYFSKRAREGKKVNLMGTFGVSGATGEGVESLAQFLLEHTAGRNVYVVGCANSGKSTLCQALVTEMVARLRYAGSRGLRRKRSMQQLDITRSHLPGTTLQSIRIPCFKSYKHAMFDTPGLLLPHRIAHSLFPPNVMERLLRPNPVVGQEFVVPADHSLLVRLALPHDSMQPPPVLARVDVTNNDAVAILYGVMVRGPPSPAQRLSLQSSAICG